MNADKQTSKETPAEKLKALIVRLTSRTVLIDIGAVRQSLGQKVEILKR